MPASVTITIEGPPVSGKTTLAMLIANLLKMEARGFPDLVPVTVDGEDTPFWSNGFARTQAQAQLKRLRELLQQQGITIDIVTRST